MDFATLKVPGADAIRLLNEHRSRYRATGQYPFLIGDDNDLGNLKHEVESRKRKPAAIIQASLDIKPAEWIAERAEYEEDDFSDETMGEWPGEILDKGSIGLHKELSSGKIKPEVYLGLPESTSPGICPRSSTWEAGTSAPNRRSTAHSIGNGRKNSALKSPACPSTRWNVRSRSRRPIGRRLSFSPGSSSGTARTSWRRAVTRFRTWGPRS
jgi:hypothetical protein